MTRSFTEAATAAHPDPVTKKTNYNQYNSLNNKTIHISNTLNELHYRHKATFVNADSALDFIKCVATIKVASMTSC